MRSRVSGFTLIELIVVIVVLGVLAAVAIPRFMSARDEAERAAVETWIGSLRIAYKLAHAAQMIGGNGYTTAPHQMLLQNLVRCDNVDVDREEADGTHWQGHYIALSGIRNSVFEDPEATACNQNVITFTAMTGRTVTITNASTGVTWTASPSY